MSFNNFIGFFALPTVDRIIVHVSAVPGRVGPAAVPGRVGPAAVPGRFGPAAVSGRVGPAAVPGSVGPAAVPGRVGPAAVPGRVGLAVVIVMTSVYLTSLALFVDRVNVKRLQYPVRRYTTFPLCWSRSRSVTKGLWLSVVLFWRSIVNIGLP